MGNLFIEYMSKVSKTNENDIKEEGPVITISRQYGCYATEIAKLLSERLSKDSNSEWDYITKEILEESANRLNVNEKEISHVFGADTKGFLGNLVLSFSGKKYTSESIVINTIRRIVRKFSEQGNVIIVGRAGCTIAKDIDLALHIRIIAPFEYRVKAIKERFGINEAEAIKKVQEVDKNRQKFMTFFKEKRKDDEIFDIILNRSKMTSKEMVETIVAAVRARKLI